MQISIDPGILRDFPGVGIGLIHTVGLDNSREWPRFTESLATFSAHASTGHWQPYPESHPAVASWHAAYRAFGSNPRRFRPSLDALSRRVGKSRKLPQISPGVDAYNLISLQHGFPAGAFDLAKVDGQILIEYAQGSEPFTPLGEEIIEFPNPGEVIYRDNSGVLTRHWNHRDSDRTKLVQDSCSALFIIESLNYDEAPNLLEAAISELQRFVAPHSAKTAVHYLDGSTSRLNLTESADMA